jgi:ADP-ribose pyrophosphatase
LLENAFDNENYRQVALRKLLENAFDNDKNANVMLDGLLGKYFYEEDSGHRGYVDDPRNTDNAWIETIAYHLPIHYKSHYDLFNNYLRTGGGAKSIDWYSAENVLNKKMCASHSHILKQIMPDIEHAHLR